MTLAGAVQWKKEYRPCPICHARSFRILGSRGGASHHSNKGVETSIVLCKKCGTYYALPTLIPETNPYSMYTPNEYFVHHNSIEKIKWGESLASYGEKILGHKGDMLEIGCGRGELLVGARNKGWNVYGVEMTDDFASVARSNDITIEQSSVENCKLLQTHTFNFISLPAILEHLYTPYETLVQVYKALKPNGLIFLDVPNESSLSMMMAHLYMRLRGRKWSVNLSPTFSPYHVVGFSPKSLQQTLEQVGFTIVEISTPKWANLIPNKTFMQKVEHHAFGLVQQIGAKVRMGDGIVCWAQKRASDD